MVWIFIYVLTVILSIQLHLTVGYMIKRRFKALEMAQELKDFQKSFNQKEGILRRWSKYIVFLVPILNILIVVVEISHKDKNISLLRSEIKKMKNKTEFSKNEDFDDIEIVDMIVDDIPHREDWENNNDEEELDFSEDYKKMLSDQQKEDKGYVFIDEELKLYETID